MSNRNTDTFEFHFEDDRNDLNSDGVVDVSDFNIWQRSHGTSAAEDDNEPGLPGVTIYADLNFNGYVETSGSDDFSA